MLKTVAQSEPHPLVELYSTIQDELGQVEKLLATELTSRFEFVNDLLTRSNRLSGKRLRPALLLLFGKAFGELSKSHIKLATAIEMVHTATLVHDDVLDSANQRRHAKTINCEFGNQAAILTGDYLFSHAFYLTSTLETTFAAREIGLATNKVCEGEIRQIGTKQQYDITEQEYFEIIDGKTAVLCSCAARLGAYQSGSNEKQIRAAGDYGTYLGIAFQIVDDLLDISGNENETGKSLGTDLEQHKPTLSIIHHLQTLPAQDREEFMGRLLRDEISADQVKLRLQESQSIDYARATAEKFAARAIEALSEVENQEIKAVLSQLPGFVLSRTH